MGNVRAPGAAAGTRADMRQRCWEAWTYSNHSRDEDVLQLALSSRGRMLQRQSSPILSMSSHEC